MATYLNYPFNPELFNYNWANEKDLTLTAMIESGAVQNNSELARLISNGSDFYTLPFYKTIGGTPDNYDGKTNITISDPEGGSQSGIVYGRAHGWREQDFVVDYNSGADPMRQITSQVAKYWGKVRQGILVKILGGVFGVNSGDYADAWGEHTLDISSADSVTDANKVGATTVGDAIQKAVGDAADQFGLAVMHSRVATNLAGLGLLEFRKYTAAQGIERKLNIADINGMTVIIDDGVPFVGGKYETYLFGTGAIQYAPASVKTPSEVMRNATENGGYNALVTRVRETLHPNGFSFAKPSGYAGSPTDAQLGDSANWSIEVNPKGIAIARIISNG